MNPARSARQPRRLKIDIRRATIQTHRVRFWIRWWAGFAVRSALTCSFLAPCLVYGADALTANGVPSVTESEIRRATQQGPVRVLVELRIPRATGHAGDPLPPDTDAIAEAQRAVLSRLPSAHFSLVRRFETVPFLALEIDADALTALENVGALVARILVDRTVAPAASP